jgi:hypothetical protein
MSAVKPSEPTPAQRFGGLLKQVLSVPKAELDRRETEYRKQRKNRSK